MNDLGDNTISAEPVEAARRGRGRPKGKLNPRIRGVPRTFYDHPETAEETMVLVDLKRLLVEHNGRLMAQGQMWEIKSKAIGPGVYRVRLERAASSVPVVDQADSALPKFEADIAMVSAAVRE